MTLRFRVFGRSQGRVVLLAGTNLAWTGLDGWLAVADELRRRWRPCARSHAQIERHCLGLDVGAIRGCVDLAVLGRADDVLQDMRRGFGRLRWPVHDLDRAAELRVEVRNQAARVAAGRLGGPRAKGPRLDPRRLPDDRLLVLLQGAADGARRASLDAERRARGL
jgi:hypothetical protein